MKLPGSIERLQLQDPLGVSKRQVCNAKFISVEEFLAHWRTHRPHFLASGHNGAIFVSNDSSRVFKISHRIAAALGLLAIAETQAHDVLGEFGHIRAEWLSLKFEDTYVRAITEHPLRREDIGPSAPIQELYGALVWRVFSESTVNVSLPATISSDGLACIRPFVHGELVSTFILRDQANDTPNRLVWASIAMLQRCAIQVLEHFGLGVDVINPGNIVIEKSQPSVVLHLIDSELLAPGLEIREYHASVRGRVLPIQPDDIPVYVEWPLAAEQIVQSKLWGLSYEQALTYISCLHETSLDGARRVIAALPTWRIDVNPKMVDDRHIRTAIAELTR